MKLQINKQAILEEARVVASFNKDGNMTQHHGMELPRKRVFSKERVEQNKADIARVKNTKKVVEENAVKLGTGGLLAAGAGTLAYKTAHGIADTIKKTKEHTSELNDALAELDQ